MSKKRSSTNLPDYHFNTRKIERNETLREVYPAFEPSSNIKIIHAHYQSIPELLDELIAEARRTTYFTLDTECQAGETVNRGALIQIQIIRSINNSTVVLIETNYLPEQH